MTDSTPKSYSSDPTLWLYTSLSSGSSTIVTATSRLETILKANKIPFKALDVATDEKARMLWGRRAGKRKLPGLVKFGMVIGDLEEIEEWNEYGEIQEHLGSSPSPSRAAVSSPAAPPPAASSLALSTAGPASATTDASTPSKNPAPSTTSGLPKDSASSSNQPDLAPAEKAVEVSSISPPAGANESSLALAMRQVGFEAAKKAADAKKKLLSSKSTTPAVGSGVEAVDKPTKSDHGDSTLPTETTEETESTESDLAKQAPGLKDEHEHAAGEASETSKNDNLVPESKPEDQKITDQIDAQGPESPLPLVGTETVPDSTPLLLEHSAEAEAPHTDHEAVEDGPAKVVDGGTLKEKPDPEVATDDKATSELPQVPPSKTLHQDAGGKDGESALVAQPTQLDRTDEPHHLSSKGEDDAPSAVRHPEEADNGKEGVKKDAEEQREEGGEGEDEEEGKEEDEEEEEEIEEDEDEEDEEEEEEKEKK